MGRAVYSIVISGFRPYALSPQRSNIFFRAEIPVIGSIRPSGAFDVSFFYAFLKKPSDQIDNFRQI